MDPSSNRKKLKTNRLNIDQEKEAYQKRLRQNLVNQTASDYELPIESRPSSDDLTQLELLTIPTQDIETGLASSDSMDSEVESNVSSNSNRRKSVHWPDLTHRGSLAETRPALNYNRKELSYAPKVKVRFGIWSPLQKKIMIGCGIGFAVLLIILLIVIFAVVKNDSETPPAPPGTPLAPNPRT